MRILVISHAAERTGAPISALQLSRAFKRAGHQVFAVLRRSGPLLQEFQAIGPTEIFRRKSEFGFTDLPAQAAASDLGLALKCLRNPDRPYCLSRNERNKLESIKDRIQRWKPDAIYCNTSHCGDVLSALEIDAPVLTHIRELGPTIAQLDPRRRNDMRERTDKFVCVSKHSKMDFLAATGIDSNHVEIEPPAIEFPNKVFGHERARHSIGMTQNDRLVIGVGTVGKRKGSELFYEAAKLYLSRNQSEKSVVFSWFGTGPWLSRLRQKSENEGFSRRIVFPGEWPNLWPIYDLADLLLCTSSEDAYPRAQIEAASMGTTCICFGNTGGGEEFINAYQCGKIVGTRRAEALASEIELFFSTERRQKPNFHLQVRAERSTDASAKKILELMENIGNGKISPESSYI